MTYYDNPQVNDWQRQIIIGTILGGSSIVKPKGGRNCYLFMRSANRNWLNYKAKELFSLGSQRPFTQEGNTIRWHSNCYPIFTEYHNLFYINDKKSVKMEVLDILRDIGLAIWYGDAGKLEKDKVVLNTNKFGEEGNEIIANYFEQAQIGKTIPTKERKYCRLVFTKEATHNFLVLVADRLPDFLHSQLLPK